MVDRGDFGPAMPITAGETFLDGVWKSRGYGWLLDVRDGAVARYEIGESYCYRLPEAVRGRTDMLSIPFRFYRRLPSREVVSFQYLIDDAGPVFDRLDAMPQRCYEGVPDTADASLDILLALFETHYAHFERRGVAWPDLKTVALEAYEAEKGEVGLEAAADIILKALQDSHTKIVVTGEAPQRRLQYGLGETLPRIRSENTEYVWLTGIFSQLKTEILDEGARHVGNDRILWGTIDGRIGYIQIFVMGGFTQTGIDDPGWGEAEIAFFDTIMEEAKMAFAGMDAVIIDLSNNRGGYDKIARRLAEHFITEPAPAYVTNTKGASVVPHTRMLMPAGKERYDGPLIVMTSDVTVSGGELATLSLRQLPSVVHVGRATRGAFSTPLAKGLPNGWVVELSNETFASPAGTVYEGRGIDPDIDLEIYKKTDPVVSHGKAIKCIVENIDSLVRMDSRACP